MAQKIKRTSKKQWCLENGIPEKYADSAAVYVDKMKSAKAFAISETINFNGEELEPTTKIAFLTLWRTRGNVQTFVIGQSKPELFMEVQRIGFTAEYKNADSVSTYIDCYPSDDSFTKPQALILRNCPSSAKPFEKAYIDKLSAGTHCRLFKSPALVIFEQTKQEKMGSVVA